MRLEFDIEPVEKLMIFAEISELTEVIPDLVDAEVEIGFHDQLDGSDMEIGEHLVVSSETSGVVSFARVDRGLQIPTNVESIVASVDSLVVVVIEVLQDIADLYVLDLLMVDMDEDLHVKHYFLVFSWE